MSNSPKPRKKFLLARLEKDEAYETPLPLLQYLLERNYTMALDRVYVDQEFKLVEVWIKEGAESEP